MKLKGTIQRILPMQSGTSQKGNQWQKVEFIVEESGAAYPDILCISALNDKVEELVGINQGDLVEVDFSCRCNEYNGRVYNSLTLFKIEKAGQAAQQAPQPMAPPASPQEPMPIQGDDLPF